MPILVPGIGAQGGDLEQSVVHGLDSETPNLIINSSRGITYRSRDPLRFQDAARSAAGRLRDSINDVLSGEGKPW